MIIVDSNIMVKDRIRKILSDQEMKIYEALNRRELLNLMEEHKNNVDLIVTDIELDTDRDFDGISLIRIVKSRSDMIPVVVLTSESKKDVITQYLLAGSADYILKPFEDQYLKEKLLRHINIESLSEFTVLKFSLMNYLEHEIYKARKGRYAFTLLKNTFVHEPANQDAPGEQDFYRHAREVYATMKALFWESDLYIQHGYHSHLGFFPFCDHASSRILSKKIAEAYQAYQMTQPEMLDYTLVQRFSTYPCDGETPRELLEALETDRS
jgi:CheY-like chemotaxis protein